MSFLYFRAARAPLRTSFSATTTTTSRLPRSARPSFSTSSNRAALNEAHGKDRKDIAEHSEAKKQEQLQEQRDGKGKWRQELSSNSEQAIKADRGEIEASTETIAQMQKETAQSAETEKKR